MNQKSALIRILKSVQKVLQLDSLICFLDGKKIAFESLKQSIEDVQATHL